MEATAWFCQPSPPSPHPACLLLFFSLSGYKMSQGLSPNLPWVLQLAPCFSVEVTLEASTVPSKPGVSRKGNCRGNRTLEKLGTGKRGVLLSPFMSQPFKMSWPGGQPASPLEEGCTARRAGKPGAREPGKEEMLRQSPSSKPSEVSRGSWVEAGGVARQKPMKHGAQEGSAEPCWHDGHEAYKSTWQSALGPAAVSGTMSWEDHHCFGVLDVRCWNRCKSCGLSQCTSSPS